MGIMKTWGIVNQTLGKQRRTIKDKEQTESDPTEMSKYKTREEREGQQRVSQRQQLQNRDHDNHDNLESRREQHLTRASPYRSLDQRNSRSVAHSHLHN